MKSPHAIFLGLGLIALAILFVGRADRATAQGGEIGTYAVASGGNMVAIVNTATGEAWRCSALDIECTALRLKRGGQ